MIGFWFLFLATLGEQGFVQCRWASRSPRGVSSPSLSEEARNCYADMLKDGDISNLLLDVTNPEKIDYFCGRMSRLKRCVADNEHHLSNTENTAYLQKTRGVNTFYLNVCPPGTDITQKYKGNAACFQLIRNQILSCGSDLPDMSSFRMRNDLNSRCCALFRHRSCVTEAAHEHCGREAGQVVSQILSRYFQTQLEGCRDVDHHMCDEDHEVTEGHRTYDQPARRFNEDHGTTTESWKHPSTPAHHWMDQDYDSAGVSLVPFVSSLLIVLVQLLLPK